MAYRSVFTIQLADQTVDFMYCVTYIEKVELDLLYHYSIPALVILNGWNCPPCSFPQLSSYLCDIAILNGPSPSESVKFCCVIFLLIYGSSIGHTWTEHKLLVHYWMWNVPYPVHFFLFDHILFRCSSCLTRTHVSFYVDRQIIKKYTVRLEQFAQYLEFTVPSGFIFSLYTDDNWFSPRALGSYWTCFHV